jgi:hypothetical protein
MEVNKMVKLKVIMEQGAYRSGCGCGFYSPEEKNSFPKQQENRRKAGELLCAVRERYGDKVDISIVDPRNVLTLWDNIRYQVRPARPVWVLDRQKICDGLPELADLQEAIDKKLANSAA